MKNFALIGAAGFVAPRHLQAIAAVDGNLVAATDPSDSVGVLDKYFPQTRFFTEIERFDRYLEKKRREPGGVDFVSICSPNYLHDAHIRLALRVRANAICEKPLVISPWNLDALERLEEEYERRVYTVLQLRLLPGVKALKEKYENYEGPPITVNLRYVTRRGGWYHQSWKGNLERSGGLAMNIGIHFFDILLWVFGEVRDSKLTRNDAETMSGNLEMKKANVNWLLSVDENELPEESRKEGKHAYRSIMIGGSELDLSSGFGDLHTAVYQDILDGNGFGVKEARPAVELVHGLR